jgi:hypothetical protein
MKEEIYKFINEYKSNNQEEIEEFSNFLTPETIWKSDINERKQLLLTYIKRTSGSACEEVYKALIEFAILIKSYELNSSGSKSLSHELKSIGTKIVPRKIYRRAERFYFCALKTKKDSWKLCKVAPTYWNELTNSEWDKIKSDLK